MRTMPKAKNRAASLILPIVIVLAAATVAAVATLKISLDSYQTSVEQSKQELAKMKTLDRLSTAAAVLVDTINRVVAIKADDEPSDAVSGAFLQALLRAGSSVAAFDAAVAAAPIDELPNLNVDGGMFEIFEAADQVEYNIECRSNCTGSTEHYPKTFLITVTDASELDSGTATTATVTAEVRQAVLADYSTIVFREIEPELRFGAGQHAKIGIFWDTDFQAPGTIRFVHPVGTEFSATKLVTNTTVDNIDFFTITSGGHQGDTMIEVGDVSIPGGVLASSAPDVEVATSVADIIVGATQGGNPDVKSCRVIMGCNSGNCTIEIMETLSSDPLTEVTAVSKRTPVDGDVFYSPASDGCRIDRDANNDAANEIYFGTANMTIVTPQGFDLSMSITPDPDLDPAVAGNVLFASQLNDALRFTPDTILLSGKTIQATHATGAGTYPNDIGFKLNVGALTTDEMPRDDGIVTPAKAIGYSPGTLDTPPSGVTMASWGNLQTSGPKHGGGMYATKLVDSDGDRRVGFETHEASYPARWIYQSAPGLSSSTTSDHMITFSSIVMDWGGSLINALASVGLDYDDSATAPPMDDGPTGGSDAPTHTVGGGGGGCNYCYTADGGGGGSTPIDEVARDLVMDFDSGFGGFR